MYYFITCKNCTSSLAQAAESSAESFSAIPASALSNSTPTAGASCSRGKETASSRASRSGTTSSRSTAIHGEDGSTSSQAAFPAKASAWRAAVKDWTIKSPASGASRPASLAKWDPVTCSWKTRQRSLFGGGYESLATLPRWGMCADGELWALPTPSGLAGHRAWIMSVLEFGFTESVPTPRAQAINTPARVPTPNCPNGDRAVPEDALFNESGLSAYDTTGKKVQVDLNNFVKRMPTITCQDASNNCGPSQSDRDALNVTVGGALNPDWCEWLMGWPIYWSSLEPLPPANFQQWLFNLDWWKAEPAGIPRTAKKVPNRVARLTAIGNGQVPASVALAWRILA